MLIRCGAHFGFRTNLNLLADGVLDVGVQPRVGIELGGVARQEEDFDAAPALSQPSLHGLAVMHAQVVQTEALERGLPTPS